MQLVVDTLRTRFVPAVLTAAGAALIAAGLLTYMDPAAAGVPSQPAASPVTAATTPRPSAEPSPSASPSARASGSPAASARPGASGRPSASPSPPPERVATRIAIPALEIDLPVIRPPNDDYPLCDVALFMEEFDQPGQGSAIYIYAHARRGMFLPLLEQSRIRDGRGMLGTVVQVWTNDEQLFLYEISEVLRHQTTLDGPIAADHEQLWMQTSEGPRGTVPKLQVVAEPISSGPAPDPDDAHPTPRPEVCG